MCSHTFHMFTLCAAQVPAVFLCTTYWRNDLIGLYTGMCIGYGVLVVLYSVIASTRYVQSANGLSISQQNKWQLTPVSLTLFLSNKATGKSMLSWHTNDPNRILTPR